MDVLLGQADSARWMISRKEPISKGRPSTKRPVNKKGDFCCEKLTAGEWNAAKGCSTSAMFSRSYGKFFSDSSFWPANCFILTGLDVSCPHGI
jgi:hypothetical protein